MNNDTRRLRPTRPPNRAGRHDPRRPIRRTVFRYPGGKHHMAAAIYKHFDFHGIERYVEPMVGGGALFIRVLERTSLPITIADLDEGVISVWNAVINDPTGLCTDIERVTPSPDTWVAWKEAVLEGDTDPIKVLGVNRWSPNGRGVKSGGPARKTDERWDSTALTRTIRQLHVLGAGRVTVDHANVFDVISTLQSTHLAFVDPPFVRAGPGLYRYAFTEADHRRLADQLRACPARWFVSYDDDELIRDLYGDFRINEIENRGSTELLVHSTHPVIDASRNVVPQQASKSLARP